MRLPRPRFTLLGIMAGVALVCLILAMVARRERYQKVILNQRITVAQAEANFRNAELASEVADEALARSLAFSAEPVPKSATGKPPIEGRSDDRAAEELRSLAAKARATRIAKHSIWELEQATLRKSEGLLAPFWPW